MDLTSNVKRAPKWALLTAGGVTLGVIGIKVWKGRATDATAADATDPTQVGTPTSVGGGATPVITPPVIIGGDQGDNGAMSDILTGLVGSVTGSLDNAVSTIGGLASGDQSITQSAVLSNTDIATAALANAGSPPAPAAQSPIIVQIPAPGPVAGHAPAKGTPRCPSSFPLGTPGDCYRCENNTGTDRKKYPKVHIHQSGRHVASTSC